VDFQPQEIRQFQHLAEQSTHVFQMRQRPLGIRVSLAAEDLVAIDRELVVAALRLRRRPRDKLRQQRTGGLELAGANFEIRMDADGGLADGLVVWEWKVAALFADGVALTPASFPPQSASFGNGKTHLW
jgi:hypothetical protein